MSALNIPPVIFVTCDGCWGRASNCIRCGDKGYIVSAVTNHPEPTTADIAEAHAHRVVAAGELVAELVAALREIAERRLIIEMSHGEHQTFDFDIAYEETVEVARAALARAEGAAP